MSDKMNEKEFIPVSMSGGCLLCPICGSNFVRFAAVECHSSSGTNRHVIVNEKGISLDPKAPSIEDGLIIRLRFKCINGDAFEFKYSIYCWNPSDSQKSRAKREKPLSHGPILRNWLMTMKKYGKEQFEKITMTEGLPFIARYNKEGIVTNIIFNQNWNAAFLKKIYKIRYVPSERMFYHYKPEMIGWKSISADELKFYLSESLAAYWRNFHSELAGELLPRRSNRMLQSSINLLKGRLEKAEANLE